MTKPNWLWTAVVTFLVVVIVVGGIILWSRYQHEKPIEISLPKPQEPTGQIYVGGAVNSPGLYSLKLNDSINSLIQSAGGATGGANLTGLEIYVPGPGVRSGYQKVDINHAEAWLLEALPGIGPTLATRIIDYRQQNGLFNNIQELLNVPGIGAGIYDKFKDQITVDAR